MKGGRRYSEKKISALMVLIGGEILVGAILFALLLSQSVVIAVFVLLLSLLGAVVTFFARRRLSVCERQLREAQKELAEVRADNELLRLSLGQEEEGSAFETSEGLFDGVFVQEIAASDENAEESGYHDFGVMPEELVSYFGKKKIGNSSSAVYRAMSRMDARIRELEAVNRDLTDRLSASEKKED